MLLTRILILLLLPAITYSQSNDNTFGSRNDTLRLNEVVVKSSTAMRIHKDTVSFSPDSFYRNPNAVTEDVLKRLPGVEVDKEGNILSQGKPVNKLLINGKEYRGEDLKTMTQNIPAEMLEKISIADWYDEDAQFLGLKQNAEQKMINLQLKKDNSRVHGKATAGHGTKGRYIGNALVNSVGRPLQAIGTMAANNTGISLSRSDKDEPSAAAKQQPGVNKALSVGGTFTYDYSKKLELSGGIDFSTIKNKLEQTAARTTYIAKDSILLKAQHSERDQTTKGARASLNCIYKLNPHDRLQTEIGYFTKFSGSNMAMNDESQAGDAGDVMYERSSQVVNTKNSAGLNFSSTFRKRLSKNRRGLTAGISIASIQNSTDGATAVRNQYYLPIEVRENNFYTTEYSRTTSTRFNMQYSEPVGTRGLILLGYGPTISIGRRNRFVENEKHNERDRDSLQTQAYAYTTTEQPITLSYFYTGERSSMNAGIELRPYKRQNEYDGSSDVQAQTGTNFFPRFGLQYGNSAKRKISFNYTGNIKMPELGDLQPVPNYIDSLNITIGNPYLKPEISHRISTTFHANDIQTQRSAWLTFWGRCTSDKIIYSSEMNVYRRISTPINANGYYAFGANGSHSRPAFAKRIKSSLTMSASYSSNISAVNGQFLTIRQTSLQPALKMSYLSRNGFEIDVQYDYRLNSMLRIKSKKSVQQAYTTAASGTIPLPAKARLGFYISYLNNKGTSSDIRSDFVLANVLFEKSFGKQRDFTIRIQAFDIFNSYPTFNRVWGENYFEDVTVNRIGNFYMLSLMYKFIR